jgi:uncharacterized protein (UPF0335 family)
MIRPRAGSVVASTTPPDVPQGAVIANGQLLGIVEGIEKLEEDNSANRASIRERYTEANGKGYNVKALKRIVRERRQDAGERAEMEATMDAYRAELGMAVQLVEGGLSLREASRVTGVSKSSIHRALPVPDVSHETDSGTADAQAGAEDNLDFPVHLDRRQPSP